jgi:hypothetical protein
MRRTSIRIIALSLAILALAAPAALARPAQDPPVSVQQQQQAVTHDDGTDWNTLALVGGIVLVAVGAAAGLGAARIRRTHATA